MKRRFPDGLPLLDPIEDMGIKDNGLRTVVRVSNEWNVQFRGKNTRICYNILTMVEFPP